MFEGTQRNIEDVETSAAMNMNKPVAEHLKDKSQRYCIMTVVAPEGTNQKSKEMMIRVHGCRASLADANKWAKRLRESNQYFDVYTLKCHEWAPMPPRIDQIENVQTMDERIQAIHDQFKAEKKGQMKALEDKITDAHKEIALNKAKRKQQEAQQALARKEDSVEDPFAGAAAAAAAAVANRAAVVSEQTQEEKELDADVSSLALI